MKTTHSHCGFVSAITSQHLDSSKTHLNTCCLGGTRLLPKKILKGPSELNAENLGAQHMKRKVLL